MLLLQIRLVLSHVDQQDSHQQLRMLNVIHKKALPKFQLFIRPANLLYKFVASKSEDIITFLTFELTVRSIYNMRATYLKIKLSKKLPL